MKDLFHLVNLSIELLHTLDWIQEQFLLLPVFKDLYWRLLVNKFAVVIHDSDELFPSCNDFPPYLKLTPSTQQLKMFTFNITWPQVNTDCSNYTVVIISNNTSTVRSNQFPLSVILEPNIICTIRLTSTNRLGNFDKTYRFGKMLK